MKKIIFISFNILLYCSALFAQTEIWKMQDYSLGQTINSFPFGFQNTSPTMAEIIKLTNGTYRMYLNVQRTGPIIKQCIGYAESPDAIHWNYIDTCFCGPLDTTARNYILGGASVVRLSSGQYRMYYRTSQKTTSAPAYHIRSAISDDGINFIQEGIRIDVQPYNMNSPFRIAGHGTFWEQSDGTFAGIFSGNPDTSQMGPSHLFLTTSPDGLTWGNFSLLYQRYHDPKVLKKNGQYILYAMNEIKYMAKAVSPDGINWPLNADSVSFLDTVDVPMIINNTKRIGDVAGVVMPDNEIYLYTNFGSATGLSRDIIRFELQNPVMGIHSADNEESSFNIFPNPFSDRTLLSAEKTFKNTVITVYNMLGQEVRLIRNISGTTFTLARGNLPAGIYFLRLTEGSKVYTHKLIITDR